MRLTGIVLSVMRRRREPSPVLAGRGAIVRRIAPVDAVRRQPADQLPWRTLPAVE
jgi:hypothetical protein